MRILNNYNIMVVFRSIKLVALEFYIVLDWYSRIKDNDDKINVAVKENHRTKSYDRILAISSM